MSTAREIGLPSAGATRWQPFRKSSYSGGGGCVEVSISDLGDVRVRDSKLTDGPELSFDRREWTAFLLAVHDGEFELP